MPNSLNPLALLARRWQPSATFVERAALATVVMAVLIVVGGGAVRLTDSGLGCPTWPTCTPQSLTPTRAMGIHGAIEFTNRMITDVLCVVVGVAILAARSRSPWRRGLTRLAWAQFWVVMGNAVLGGIVVLTGLNPYLVGSHDVLAFSLLTVAVLMWHRTREGDAPVRDLAPRPVRQLTWVLAAATAGLLLAGTVVTGAGPHAGDARKVHRIPVDWREVTQLHTDFVWIVVGLTVALWFVLRATGAGAGPLRRVAELFWVLMAQGVIGYVQYATHVPVGLVEAHMFGACLVWIAMLRVVLSLRERPAATAEGDPALPAQDSARGPAQEPAQGSGVTTAV
ncbi:COX15/CtaA family protein [Streptomyces sp. SL13]|uniref:COX15/CtaA family protein n=1 Tax=Streptantibioticus silvisoli TaxID=2705255 RepID=A0AA90H9A2_9ACTN|nr:COX15/CtaA family protein [Streptantibioticus silvisoli]MDI5973178.1 COX15/CtaA family protein [Streptantibioticus silvisoli]